jgi:hypothetical protein
VEVLPEPHALLSPFSPAMDSDALNSKHLGRFYHEILPTRYDFEQKYNKIPSTG